MISFQRLHFTVFRSVVCAPLHHDAEGFSYDEIADITDSPLGTVKGRLFRARRDLIEMLRRNTYDWELPE